MASLPRLMAGRSIGCTATEDVFRGWASKDGYGWATVVDIPFFVGHLLRGISDPVKMAGSA